MGDSCSSPRTASSRVSPRRATASAPIGDAFLVLSPEPIASIYQIKVVLARVSVWHPYSGLRVPVLWYTVRSIPAYVVPVPEHPLSPDRKPTPPTISGTSTSQRAGSGPTTHEPATRKPGERGHRDQASRGGRRPPRSLPRRLLKWFGFPVLAFFLLGAAAFAVGYTTTDIPDPNRDFQTQTTFVYYADGKHEIGHFADQNRTSIPLSDVPQHVQDAVVAAEDRTFYTNKGIDPKGILRAAFSNARGNSTQGASTITQQYVKVFYLSQERTITRKVHEAFLSLKLQRSQSKDEILQGYLNTIYFGRGAYGIQAASQAYFNKDAKDLTVPEGAVLAAVLNSPVALDPAQGPEAKQRLFGRYQYVLDGMAKKGDISAADADSYKARLPAFPQPKQADDQYGGQKGFMLTMVKKELLANGISDQEITGGGLRVTTTFTRNSMAAAKLGVAAKAPKGLKGLHVASATIDPASGALRGFYAGQDYLKSQLNWAVLGGSPGSAFKPFALAAGIDDGYSLKSTFQGNSPYVFPDGKKVVNEGPGEGNDYGAAVPLTEGIEQSVNTVFVDLTESMHNGPQKIKDMAVKMGVPSDAPGLTANAVISLGSATI